MQVLQFFLSNFKPKSKNGNLLQDLRIHFEQIEQIIQNQSYVMVMFLDMFKEINQAKYSSQSVQKVLSRYPLCDQVDIRLDEVIQRIQ